MNDNGNHRIKTIEAVFVVSVICRGTIHTGSDLSVTKLSSDGPHHA